MSYPSEQVRPTWPARHTRPRAGRIELWELEGMSEILTVDDLASGLKMSKAQVYNLYRARSVAHQALKSAFCLPATQRFSRLSAADGPNHYAVYRRP